MNLSVATNDLWNDLWEAFKRIWVNYASYHNRVSLTYNIDLDSTQKSTIVAKLEKTRKFSEILLKRMIQNYSNTSWSSIANFSNENPLLHFYF